jgi:hypothetical protein
VKARALTLVEPVNETFLILGSSHNFCPISGVVSSEAVMTLTTPSAYPTSVHSFAKAVVVIGVSGEGLHTTVQPAARAVVIFRTAITSG